MAAEAPEAPEVRALASDGQFRRFVDVCNIETPKLHVDRIVEGDGKVRNELRWAKEAPRALVDADGAGTKHLQALFMKFSLTKKAWRRTVPSFFSAPLSLFGVAPRLGRNDCEESAAAAAKAAPRAAAQLVVLLLAAVLLQGTWPMWKVLIDPEANENYKILGVRPGATRADIKRAFREKSKSGELKHPDQGGNAAKYMRARQAYEELLEQKDTAEEDTLSEEVKENNLQVIAFIGFVLGRMYNVSRYGAEFVVMLFKVEGKGAGWTQAVVHLVCTSLFVFESGVSFNSLLLIYNTFSYLKRLVENPAVQLAPDHSHVAWETPRYLLAFFLPAAAYYTAATWVVFDFVSAARILVGCAFLASFIVRSRPYIFLQHALKSRVYAGVNPMRQDYVVFGRELPPLAVMLFHLAVDDLLAYALHVPAPFRIACFAVFAISFFQRIFLPALGVLPFGNRAGWEKCMQEMVVVVEKKEALEQQDASAAIKKMDGLQGPAPKAARTAKEKKEDRKRELEEEKGMRESVSALLSLAGGVAGFVVLLAVVQQAARGGIAVPPAFRQRVKDFAQLLVVKPR